MTCHASRPTGSKDGSGFDRCSSVFIGGSNDSFLDISGSAEKAGTQKTQGSAEDTEKSKGIRSESTGCIPGAPTPHFWDADWAPPGSLPAGPEAAFGGPVRRGSRSLPRLPQDSMSSLTSRDIGRSSGTRVGTIKPQFSVSSVALCALCVPLLGGPR